jgi:hypothetical protein
MNLKDKNKRSKIYWNKNIEMKIDLNQRKKEKLTERKNDM